MSKEDIFSGNVSSGNDHCLEDDAIVALEHFLQLRHVRVYTSEKVEMRKSVSKTG
jgi:hypothetical protein